MFIIHGEGETYLINEKKQEKDFSMTGTDVEIKQRGRGAEWLITVAGKGAGIPVPGAPTDMTFDC